jgi:hypothetical protein
MSLIDLEDFKDVLGVGDIYPDAQLESAMESAASQFNGAWIVAGPPSHKNLSISKSIPKISIDNISYYIDSTISAWGECYEILKAMRS